MKVNKQHGYIQHAEIKTNKLSNLDKKIAKAVHIPKAIKTRASLKDHHVTYPAKTERKHT
ncbi:MAG: hypothetical protein ACOYK9_06050 [Chlamydiia bacterium]